MKMRMKPTSAHRIDTGSFSNLVLGDDEQLCGGDGDDSFACLSVGDGFRLPCDPTYY